MRRGSGVQNGQQFQHHWGYQIQAVRGPAKSSCISSLIPVLTHVAHCNGPHTSSFLVQCRKVCSQKHWAKTGTSPKAIMFTKAVKVVTNWHDPPPVDVVDKRSFRNYGFIPSCRPWHRSGGERVDGLHYHGLGANKEIQWYFLRRKGGLSVRAWMFSFKLSQCVVDNGSKWFIRSCQMSCPLEVPFLQLLWYSVCKIAERIMRPSTQLRSCCWNTRVRFLSNGFIDKWGQVPSVAALDRGG